MRDALELVRRDVLLGNPGRYGIADEQLHFPYLYESARGHWYMTYREGPHLEKRFGPGNRVQCVQSRDGGRSWLPWMGLAPEQWLAIYHALAGRQPDQLPLPHGAIAAAAGRLPRGCEHHSALARRGAHLEPQRGAGRKYAL